jgi:katanin p60 ATPase-containing subunit A1
MRFDRKPKLVRKLKDGEEAVSGGKGPRRPPLSSSSSSGTENNNSNGGGSSNSSNSRKGSSNGSKPPTKLPNVSGATSAPEDDVEKSSTIGPLAVVGTRGKPAEQSAAATEKIEDRVLKPPPQFGGDAEMRQLAGIISREIYQESPNVFFEDIVALDEAKRLLCESIQLPLRFPALFTGLLRPWKGILLHGPPGTGKTLLARAVATECSTTFFNISASTLVSKWRGDSEKLVRALFELARYHAPSTVFLDEIDSILGARGGEGQEHEASRRMKTELLIQMDGMVSGGSGSSRTSSSQQQQVFVMAASNTPWDLDVALLRRLEKRVLVPLPVQEAREAMLRKHLASRAGPDIDYPSLAASLDGYSGADLELVCREAAMRPVRRIVEKLRCLDAGTGVGGAQSIPEPPPPRGSAAMRLPRPSHGPAHATQADVDNLLRADPVVAADVHAALQTTKPSSDGNMDKYSAWQREFGSV